MAISRGRTITPDIENGALGSPIDAMPLLNVCCLGDGHYRCGLQQKLENRDRN
jgi:hypothetical protein